MLTPIDLIKATVDAMAERGFGRVVNITSALPAAPNDALALQWRPHRAYRFRGLARQPRLASRNRDDQQPAARRPDTDRLAKTLAAGAAGWLSQDAFAERRRRASPAQRLARPPSLVRSAPSWCSQQADYLTGQNLLLDGGATPAPSDDQGRCMRWIKTPGVACWGLVLLLATQC